MNHVFKSSGKILSINFTILVHLLYFILTVSSLNAQVVKESDPQLNRIDIEEHLGDTIPLSLNFIDDKGKPLTINDLFQKGKPVVLVLGYYECPMLCNLVFNGLTQSVRELKWLPGIDYQIITASINPAENWQLAQAKKQNYLTALDIPSADSGWTFLTGEESQSKALAEAVGFKYFYDEEQKQYAHPAAIYVLTENGIISRYFYGIEYNTRDMKFAIQEASEGKIGNTIDKLILYCFHYDPNQQGYVAFAGNIMRLGGSITLILMILFIFRLFWRERYRKRNVTFSQ